MDLKVYDVVVIGAGPNSLHAAYRIQKELPWTQLLVVEADEICGNILKYPEVRWHSKMKELKMPSLLNSLISDEYEPTSSELVAYYNLFCKEHSLHVRTKSQVTNVTERLQIFQMRNSVPSLLSRSIITYLLQLFALEYRII